MIYLYDGSFDGYLTVIFDSYKIIEELLGIEKTTDQLLAFVDSIEVKTEEEKARRVESSLKKHFGQNFFDDLRCLFLSAASKKEIIGARVIKALYRKGPSYLDSTDYFAINFRNIVKNVKKEVHTYKGLIRFDLIDEDLLFSQFHPKNDILTLVYPHFAKRMPLENFMIADVGRKTAMVYANGEGRFFEYTKNIVTNPKIDEKYRTIWKVFYDHIAIEERYNPSLRQNNMPKKYWNHLTEFN